MPPAARHARGAAGRRAARRRLGAGFLQRARCRQPFLDRQPRAAPGRNAARGSGSAGARSVAWDHRRLRRCRLRRRLCRHGPDRRPALLHWMECRRQRALAQRDRPRAGRCASGAVRAAVRRPDHGPRHGGPFQPILSLGPPPGAGRLANVVWYAPRMGRRQVRYAPCHPGRDQRGRDLLAARGPGGPGARRQRDRGGAALCAARRGGYAEMWFARRADGPYRLGHARSADLRHWQRDATALLEPRRMDGRPEH